MRRSFAQYQAIGRSTFPTHKRGADALGLIALFMLVGVSVSGVWQFFAHEPNPAGFGYRPDSGTGYSSASSVGAQIHDLFATGLGAVALFGTAWVAYRITHRVPALGVLTMAVAFLAAATAGTMRFSLLKFEGRAFDDVGPGYPQVFTEDFQFAVTERGQTDPAMFRFLVVIHLLSVPIVVCLGWWWLRRWLAARTAELASQPERSWFRSPPGEQA